MAEQTEQNVKETAEEKTQDVAQSGGGAGGTALKAVAAAVAAGTAAVVAKKAFSGGGSNGAAQKNGDSGNGGGSKSSALNSIAASGWDAAQDAVLPAVEEAAGAAGKFLAENGPEVLRERILPRFVESFNEARGG